MHVELPSWVHELAVPPTDASRDDRMRYVLALGRENVRREGGPFAAAIFNIDTGECVGKGVNLVQALNCSMLHAEVVAIIEAESCLHSYTLSGHGKFELYSSAEPCAMCLGAIPWSGVQRLICGARDEDVRAIGFDEGAKPDPWQDALRFRGIEVFDGVLRAEAVDLLTSYLRNGGTIYNG